MILQKEADLLQQMIDLETETLPLLVGGDIEKLEALNVRKNELVSLLAGLEEQRQEIFTVEGASLKQYLAKGKPLNSHELESLRRLILKRHASLQKKLKTNSFLLRHNLHFTNLAINYLFPWARDAAGYAPAGGKNGPVTYQAGLIDSNA
ncbi:MAG TPA: flagellar protein FlgN [Firmicutes bacterium]|nr:flagellar protein FlgN [Bacillota bacterium]